MGRSLAGAGEHRLGYVEPQDFAAGAYARGEVDSRRAAAAADVDDALAGLWVRCGDEPVGNRAQHLVLNLLTIGPFRSGDAVPIFCLRGVVGMDWRSGHGSFLVGSGGRGEWLALFDDIGRDDDSLGRPVHAAMGDARWNLESVPRFKLERALAVDRKLRSALGDIPRFDARMGVP